MEEKLELLLADGVVDEVIGRLKSGKEADIWLVRHGGQVIAAKIYRDRQTRSFKNNAAYREGRVVGNSRTQRAIDKGSRFGQAAAEEAWKSAEADALYKLHDRGVRTPTPVMFYEGVLLMELVVDAEGNPAHRLIDTSLTAEEANAHYRDLRGQMVRMLEADLIHGDLSPYNVLMGAAGPTIIDFPQIISAAQNNRAEPFFLRDFENLRRHFASFDKSLHQRHHDAREIWRAYVRRELTPDFEPPERPSAPPPHTHHERRDQHPAHGQRRDQPGQPHPRQAQQPQGQRPEQRGRPEQANRGDGRPDQGNRGGRPDQGNRGGQPNQGNRGGRPDQRRGQDSRGQRGGQGQRGPQVQTGPVVERVNRPQLASAGAAASSGNRSSQGQPTGHSGGHPHSRQGGWRGPGRPNG